MEQLNTKQHPVSYQSASSTHCTDNALTKLAMERAGKEFAAIPFEYDREWLLRSIEDTEFFGKVKVTLMMGIYNNP